MAKKVWETKDPTDKDKKLSPKKKASAKAIMQEIERGAGIMPDLPDNIANLVSQYAK